MDKLRITFKTTIFSFICFVFLSLSHTAKAQEVEDQSGFSYDPSSGIGPNQWGNIRPEWFKCGTGIMQSPIDLMNNRARALIQFGDFVRLYRRNESIIVNRGHDIQVRWDSDAGSIIINQTRYYLSQCHWHSPSEHTIDGERFDLEIQCIHQSKLGRIAVIAFMYRIGLIPDPFLAMFTDELRNIANGAKETSAGLAYARLAQLVFTEYYQYIGSLTVPPCTENVVWIVAKNIRPVCRAQVQMLRDAVNDGFETNVRPLQPLNNREVKLYRTLALI